VYDSNDNLKQRFEYADNRMPIAMTDSNGTKYYLHYDQVGSLRAVSNTSHNVLKEIVYDTYGNILTDSNTSFTVPFGFAGGLYDVDTKLTRFGYRDYDAYTGKWTAKDPIGFSGGDSNLYGYVLGDPINFFDPTGLIVWQILMPTSLGNGDLKPIFRRDPKTGKLKPISPKKLIPIVKQQDPLSVDPKRDKAYQCSTIFADCLKKCDKASICNVPKVGKPIKYTCKTGCVIQLTACRLLLSN